MHSMSSVPRSQRLYRLQDHRSHVPPIMGRIGHLHSVPWTSTFVPAASRRGVSASSAVVALAMKRKHEDGLQELRKRAGELVASASLENGTVKDTDAPWTCSCGEITSARRPSNPQWTCSKQHQGLPGCLVAGRHGRLSEKPRT